MNFIHFTPFYISPCYLFPSLLHVLFLVSLRRSSLRRSNFFFHKKKMNKEDLDVEQARAGFYSLPSDADTTKSLRLLYDR